MARKTFSVAYRFFQDDIDLVRKLAQNLGLTQTQVVRLALRQMMTSPRELNKTVKSMAEQGSDPVASTEWVEEGW